MNTEKIKELLQKYLEGETTLEEEQSLRNWFRQASEKGEELPSELKVHAALFEAMSDYGRQEPRSDFDAFAKISDDAGQAGKPETVNINTHEAQQLNSTLLWSLRIAAGIILLLIGLSAGLIISTNGASDAQVAALQQEIKQMKNALVYGTDHKLTASERISAVNISSRLPESTAGIDSEITDILIYTMNNDENVNVREAAAQALFRFRDEPRIRKALVNALNRQNDPLMQITLITMLVEMKETAAINEMQKMLLDTDTREVVKDRLEISIAELKT